MIRILFLGLVFFWIASPAYALSPQKIKDSLELKLLFHDVFQILNQTALSQKVDPLLWVSVRKRAETLLQRLPPKGQEEVRAYLKAGPIRELKNALITNFQVKLTPAQTPRLDVGQRLYVEQCLSCHGAPKQQGRLEGQMKSLSLWRPLSAQGGSPPYDPIMVVNRLLISVPESPMPKFLDFLTVQEIWDIAYYVEGISKGVR